MRGYRFAAAGLVWALTSAVFAPLGHAQAIPDYSGRWVAVAGKTEVVSRRDRTPGGWGNMLAGLGQRRDYQLTIQQTQRTVTLRFPGNTFLNVDAYQLAGAEATYVSDTGGYWRKTITTAQWTDASMILNSRTLVGWWKDARPEDVRHQETEFGMVQTLKLARDGSELVGETTLSDEKGTATYRTAFAKIAP